mmetsp:Transcript_22283/g.40142  ORF Transcript_22283/g.40142 Transcript_22283/m.40142 type:complete len:146 (+) Transcript_22283:54-491(+)
MGQVLSESGCCGPSEDPALESVERPTRQVAGGEEPIQRVPKAGARLDPDAVKTLTDMGFNEAQAKEALQANEGNLDQAMASLLADADDGAAAAAAVAHSEVDALAEKVSTLVGMGFDERDARNALDGYAGNVERAVEHLMNQTPS